MTGFEKPRIAWRKSTASSSTDCAEVAVDGFLVLIRDSANRNGVMLRVTPAAWSAFLERTRGTLPRPQP